MKKNTRRIHIKPADIPEESFRLYVQHLQTRRYSGGTLRMRYMSLRRFFAWLNERGQTVRDITPQDLDKYHVHLKGRKLAINTAFQEMTAVRSFFHYLGESQYVFLDPAANLILPRPPRELQHVPTEDDVRKLLAAPKTHTRGGLRDRAFMEVLYSTGARLEEMASATIFDVDVDRGILKLHGKGSKERLTPLGGTALRWMKDYLRRRTTLLGDDNPDIESLWLNTRGGVLSYQGAEKIVLRNAQAAGIKAFSSHALRRACATHMLRRGAHPVQIQMLLGHASLKYLSQYLNVSIGDLQKMHRQSKPGR